MELTLPGLKTRGFLDLRAAVNRRVPIFDAAKNKTVLNQKSVKTRNSQLIHDRPRGQFSRLRSSTCWKCLKSLFLFLFLKFRCAPPYFAVRLTRNLITGQAHRFYLKSDSSRFTRQLLVDGWVFSDAARSWGFPP